MMFNKEQVQKAIKEIDESLATLNGSRQAHIALTSNVKLVQDVCKTYFDEREAAKAAPEKKDVRINEPTKCPKSGNKDS